jgi:hypothetical protein
MQNEHGARSDLPRQIEIRQINIITCTTVINHHFLRQNGCYRNTQYCLGYDRLNRHLEDYDLVNINGLK